MPQRQISAAFCRTKMLISTTQAFSQIGVQASRGQPCSKEKCFIFHMLHYKLLIRAGPIAHFGWPLFKFWLKGWCHPQISPMVPVLCSFKEFHIRLRHHERVTLKQHWKFLFIRSDVLQFKVIFFNTYPLHSLPRILAIGSSLKLTDSDNKETMRSRLSK